MLILADSAEFLIAQLEEAWDSGRPDQVHVHGAGANVLVSDEGIPGRVIMNRSSNMRILDDGRTVEVDSGCMIWPDLVCFTVRHGLSGLEHFAGIPSTVGGALWQNLHFLSPDRSRTVFLEEVFESAEVISPTRGQRRLDRTAFRFGYDTSILHVSDDIVTRARFKLSSGDTGAMRHTIEENLEWRRQRHPDLEQLPSAGSIFKKVEGIGAGRLIDECGLKGLRKGHAGFFERHANIIVNHGGATAAEVCALIELAQESVYSHFGVELEPEIGFLGRGFA